MIQLKQLERRPAGAGGPTPQHKFCAVTGEKQELALRRAFQGSVLERGGRKNQNPARKHLQRGKISHSLVVLFFLDPENGVANA